MKFVKYPITKATKPPQQSGMFDVFIDHWWSVEDESLLFYRGTSPQCSRIESIATRLTRPEWDTRFIPIAYIPFSISESNDGVNITYGDRT